jgi:DNA-binding transcriptional LysR family regulator
MSETEPGWDLHRSFLGVLREGSLSGAARRLGVTQPTLGRHIDALEGALGAKLFMRTRSGLVPTQTARDLAPHAEAMEAAALALTRQASGELGRAEGTVRLTASQFVGGEVLPPILAQFHEREPRIAVELVLSDRNQDLSRRDADIAVRMVQPAQKALIARRIGSVRIGLYAHRSYLARHGAPRSIEELAHHSLIGFDRDAASLRALAPNLKIAREAFALRTDDTHAQLGALRAGFGIAGCQAGLAAREPNLVAVLPGAVEFRLDMWLAMHETLRSSRRVRLLFDHLALGLKRYLAGGSAPGAGGAR